MKGRARFLPALPLVFLSGACALTYEMAWMRELKLVFGFSTAASATVLAAFSAGLGFGAIVLGRRADRSDNPLRLFAIIEAAIGVSAAVIPFVLDLIRMIYVGLGGTPALGTGGGTLLRLSLSLLVMGGPAFLMGGTLPAIAKAVETEGDRHRAALLYGTNTLGAVIGCLLPTFLLFETLGTRATIWAMACMNLLVAVSANALGRRLDGRTIHTPTAPVPGEIVPTALVGAAAFASGFCFFFMELIWYRMLSPLLGGSTYTFGIILAVALLGIGLGGLGFSWWRRRAPCTFTTFAVTCLLEAFLLGLPFVIGDHLAVLAEVLRRGAYLGFDGQVAGWALVTALVVGPGALVAGFQFPLFITLLGSGSSQLGKHVGFAYVTNTCGCLVGSLAGGFVLLPVLGALRCWRSVVWVLAGVALLSAIRIGKRVLPVAVAALGVTLLMLAPGPSAVWRHGGIGAGRSGFPTQGTVNAVRAWRHQIQAGFLHEFEGRESSVGINGDDGVTFYVNGKADGNALADAPTQIGSGLLPAFLHPEPRRALVIGLGTGSTAGWLGAVPTIDRVDVVELEPAILRVATLCAAVNERVLDNRKVVVHTGDAREHLLVGRDRYDIIVSEPSNPYRAGIASLYTREFFEAAAARLRPGGFFLQWLQAYEIDASGLGSTLATLHTVFPHVEIWFGRFHDLFLLASDAPPRFDPSRLRARLAEPPFRAGFLDSWGALELEGIFAHRAGGGRLARLIAEKSAALVNTDDLNVLEFGLARTVGKTGSSELSRDLLRLGRTLAPEQPLAGIDPVRTAELLHEFLVEYDGRPGEALPEAATRDPAAVARSQAVAAFRAGRFADVAALWRQQDRPPTSPAEMLAAGYTTSSPENLEGPLWQLWPAERAFAVALERVRRGQHQEAVAPLIDVTRHLRERPFASRFLTVTLLKTVVQVGRKTADPAVTVALADALATPFAVNMVDVHRLRALEDLLDGSALWKTRCAATFAALEHRLVWTQRFLERRWRCYRETGHPLASAAASDLDAFVASTLISLPALLQ